MSELGTFPLEFHNISPGADFTERLPGEHTGGPFVNPDGQELWKPLDCLPYPNAPHRVETREATILERLAGTPGFPRNWRVEQANGRRFLVRKRAYLIPEEEAGMVGGIPLIQGAPRKLKSPRWAPHYSPQTSLDA